MPETKEAEKTTANTPYVFPFTIGADPEFTVISGTRPMHAEDIFRTFFSELKKGDHGFNLPGGNIGWDNHPATGELRPNPGTPREVVNNLKLLFGEAHKRMPFVDLTTLTVAASAGGHIHLSVPKELNSALEGKTPKWAAIERTIGTFILLIMIGENALSRGLRKRGSNYGDLLDFRTEQKFAHPTGERGYTIEVRGPTAEWITTEKIALGTLSYMAIAWDSILKGNLDLISSILFKNKLQAHDAVDPLLNNFANMQKMYLDKIRPLIRSHPAYKDYKAELELIMSPERVIAEKKKSHYCINEGWGFAVGSKSIPTNKFLDDDEIEEKTSKFPEQIIKNLSSFAWNEDLNVEQFATALSKRCVALGWKPQHEYFLFGMKKGLDSLIIRDENGNFVSGGEIIKNKEDYRVVENKFSRLGVKAEPMYARVLHPRTGELVGTKGSRRVMVGIPYDMRRKNDIKPLIRLILKFEKNPKAFGALDLQKLPEGVSLIKEAIGREEALENGLNTSLKRGERPREVDEEVAQAIFEAAASDQDDAPEGTASEASFAVAEEMIIRIIQLGGVLSDDEDILENQIGATLINATGNRSLPDIAHPETKLAILSDLNEAVFFAHPNRESPRPIPAVVRRMSPMALCYLICAGIGQTGSVSLEPASAQFVSVVSREGGQLRIATNSRTTRSGSTPHPEIIADLLGISSRADRARVAAMDGRIIAGIVDGAAGTIVATSGGNWRVSPNNRLPHIWNA